MEGTLKNNKKMLSENGLEYQIVDKLGEGGQGEVYKVKQNNGLYALKWYFKHTATQKQKDIIENLIKKGAPDKRFLWPIDIINEGNLFGYTMNIRPNHYKNIVDLMKRRVDPTFRALALAGANMSQSFKNLHSMGYSYCDISFGNMFFDPQNGDVLICDNDNVVVNGIDNGILGTPRFMAPEIVRSEKKPSTDTDLYSMALLLFYMLMIHHPLEGKREASIKALDINAMNQLYGTKPLFIWDPKDKSNRPVNGYHDNAILYWDLYPQFLKNLFVITFTEGLSNPKKRIVEKVWQDAFIKLTDSIMYCPKCGVEVFYDEDKRKKGVGHVCWNTKCQSPVALPPMLQIGKKNVLLNKSTYLLQHHVKDNYVLNKIVGRVVQNPTDLSKWGVQNLSDEIWLYIKVDGTKIPVEKGKSAPINKSSKIDFGSEIGEFKI
jgi:DNA-binding helix-hairpin-helix protein with protein kinase domain